MATVLNVMKYSLKYSSMVTGGESVSRTISGLNISGGSGSPGTGANRDTAITYFVNTLVNFTTGTISNVHWISDQEVRL